MRMQKLLKNCVATLAICAFGYGLNAQDLIYTPKNPAFGGNEFNYNWLITSAQAQDLTTRSDDNSSSLDDFTASLNRQLLSQLSRDLVTQQFGEDGLEDGTYAVGDFQIDVSTDLNGLNIIITDVAAGEQTTITIPFF